MKKINWRSILSSILILTLVLGLSYLGLNQVSTSKDNKDEVKMSIALVNEDDGAHFKGNDLDFGDQFTKSIGRDSDHDWYVVSRGVAENGYEKNDYNMMIVIPNDFSEKAISIESDSPESVVLNYKINASGHEGIRAEAEKTASLILNDFNRRIIDVYFASVIGNLQDAQDNIGAIVEKESKYTNTYNQSINNPLSNYTTQFESIQDNTTKSKDSFASLEDILETFENELNEDVEGNKGYYSHLSELSKLKEKNSLFLLGYAEQFGKYQDGLRSGDVTEQLAQLETANQAIHKQFQRKKEESLRGHSYTSTEETIVSRMDRILKGYKETAEEYENLQEYLQTTLIQELEFKVGERLPEAFGAGFDKLDGVFTKKKNYIQEHHLKKQIDKLPLLAIEDIENSGLSEEMITQLKNVVHATEKYKEYMDEDYDDGDQIDFKLLSTLIENIKNNLKEGLTVEKSTASIEDRAANNADSVFVLEAPDGYEISNLILEYNNKVDNIKDYVSGDKRVLGNVNAGDFIVTPTFKLIEGSEDEIDVFKPVTWDWKLALDDHVSGNQPPGDGGPDPEPEPEPDPEPDPGPDNEPKPDDSAEDTDEEIEQTNGEIPDIEDESDQVEEDIVSRSNITEANTGVLEVKEINNDYIHYKVMSPLIDERDDLEGNSLTETLSSLLKKATDIVGDHQRMLSLYEIYYGINMEDPDLPIRIAELDEGQGLGDLEGSEDEKKDMENSLHYVFQMDFAELLEDLFVDNVTEQIMEQITKPIEDLKEEIYDYNNLVNTVDKRSTNLADQITKTTEDAMTMNGALAKTLANIEDWRDRSHELANDQNEVLSNESEEQSVVMALDGDFQPLLMSSESLASQAQGNLTSADSVYQTFDAIDNQATTIQQSGVNLVAEAEDLSIKMTDKLLDDQEFADNFANVLSNSRVGDRQNENLFNFLSSPVKTENDGTIVAGDTFTPYFLVLILTIVSLFTAYVISTNDQKRIDQDLFDSEKTLISKNIPLTLIIVGIGLVEGILIGVSSGYLLNIGQESIIAWTSMITLTMVTMLVIATYLLRQFKTIGMFILLIVLSLYLFFTQALGFGFDTISFVEKLRMYSPLQYVETLLSSTAKSLANNQSLAIMFFVLIVVLLIGVTANLLVLSKSENGEEMDDEELAEAN